MASLANIANVGDKAAVSFQSHIDGSRHMLSPERSIEIQADLLGADIVMQLDECVAWPAEPARSGCEAMRLSARWAQRCKAALAHSARRSGTVRHPAGIDPRSPPTRILRTPD